MHRDSGETQQGDRITLLERLKSSECSQHKGHAYGWEVREEPGLGRKTWLEPGFQGLGSPESRLTIQTPKGIMSILIAPPPPFLESARVHPLPQS